MSARLRLVGRGVTTRLVTAVYRPRSLVVSIDSERIVIARPFASSLGRQLYVKRSAPEPETIPVFLDLIRSARTFIDVGANIGIYTLLAKKRNPKVRTVSFEPQAPFCELLAQSLSLNAIHDVVIENVALDEADGNSTLYLGNRDAEASTNPAFFSSKSRTLVGAVACRTLRLDAYCAQNRMTDIDLIKLDTESTEPRALRGATGVLAQSAPDIICEVLHGRTEHELEQVLRPFGYRFYHITDEGLQRREEIRGDAQHRHLNYLFSKRPALG